jgi:hypothetical protein
MPRNGRGAGAVAERLGLPTEDLGVEADTTTLRGIIGEAPARDVRAGGELARQHLLLVGIADQPHRGAEQLGGSLWPPRAQLELGDGRRKERVTPKPVAVLDLPERAQPGLGALGHADRDGAVERNDGGGSDP